MPAIYAITAHLAHADPLVEKFGNWTRLNLTNGVSLAEAAHTVMTSQCTVTRRLKHTLEKSPLGFFQQLRSEYALHLFMTGHDSVDQFVEQVGYLEGVTLRSPLRRKIGRSVRDLRAMSQGQRERRGGRILGWERRIRSDAEAEGASVATI